MTPRPKRKLGRLSKAAIASAVFLVSLEVVLQLFAFVAALTTKERGREVGGVPHVLCVGDSFTYGIGASSAENAYPTALQRALAEKGVDLEVVNAGWPGRTSRDVIERCAHRITADTKLLCVLVGTNDSWRHPEQLPDDFPALRVTEQGFVWRWRTWRLLRILTGFRTGAWRNTEVPETQGISASDAGAVAVTKEIASSGYQICLDHGFELRQPVDTKTPEEIRGVLRDYYGAMQRGEPQQAAELLSQAMQRHPGQPRLLMASVHVAKQIGGDTDAPIAELEALHASAPTAEVTECLMEAWRSVGENDKALALARARVAEEPAAVQGWRTIASVTFDMGMFEEFEPAVVHAVELLGASSPNATAHMLRRYARSVAGRKPDLAVAVSYASFLIDGMVSKTRLAARACRKQLTKDVYERVVASTPGVDPAMRDAFEAVIDEVYGGSRGGQWQTVLHDHLGRLCDLAAAKGCRTAILSYPFQQQGTYDVQRSVAEEKGAAWVEVSARFSAELKHRAREELFSGDGHCNDAGYALMAELVADQVVDLLK